MFVITENFVLRSIIKYRPCPPSTDHITHLALGAGKSLNRPKALLKCASGCIGDHFAGEGCAVSDEPLSIGLLVIQDHVATLQTRHPYNLVGRS